MQVLFDWKTKMAGRPQKQRSDKTFIANKLEELLEGENFAEFERKNRLPVSTVRRIMNGIDPRISTLAMIARACGVTLDYFFDGGASSRDQSPGSVERIEIIFNLQMSLAEFQSLLAEYGRDIAVGQSLKTYKDLPALLATVQKLKDLCELVAARLESYRQSDQDRSA